MLILTIRTDKPEAEVGLFEDGRKLAYLAWHAHRELAETIHERIRDLFANKAKKLDDLGGIIVFEGPGSFTGLRIGISIANALAYSLKVPVAGTAGEDWVKEGLHILSSGQAQTIALPNYGSDPKTTQQRK